jgi:hypothetical protein
MSSRKLKKLEKQMENAGSYSEWTEAAIAHDELSGAKRWRDIDQSRQYDYTEIRMRLDRLRSLRVRNDHHGLLFTLNEGIHGNMGGMGRSPSIAAPSSAPSASSSSTSPRSTTRCVFLRISIRTIIDVQQKMDFFYRANICFGRSALMLSGGGVLGLLPPRRGQDDARAGAAAAGDLRLQRRVPGGRRGRHAHGPGAGAFYDPAACTSRRSARRASSRACSSARTRRSMSATSSDHRAPDPGPDLPGGLRKDRTADQYHRGAGGAAPAFAAAQRDHLAERVRALGGDGVLRRARRVSRR